MSEELKEKCKQWALDWKEKTGKFPLNKEFILANGAPITEKRVSALFNGYNNFRNFCGATILKTANSDVLTIEHIKSRCIINDNACWVWQTNISVSGYGNLSFKGKMYRAHRAAYIAAKKEIPDNYVIRHLCHNKACCNPEHLEAGTRSQNAIDSVLLNKNTKLSENNVKTIKKDMTNLAEYKNKREFDIKYSKMFNVSEQAITAIRLGRNWKRINVD